MTAVNINIEQFIEILVKIRNNGNSMINLDMLPDDNHPSMNKLVIHPVSDKNTEAVRHHPIPSENITITDPKIDVNNNDIFNSFKDFL